MNWFQSLGAKSEPAEETTFFVVVPWEKAAELKEGGKNSSKCFQAGAGQCCH